MARAFVVRQEHTDLKEPGVAYNTIKSGASQPLAPDHLPGPSPIKGNGWCEIRLT